MFFFPLTRETVLSLVKNTWSQFMRYQVTEQLEDNGSKLMLGFGPLWSHVISLVIIGILKETRAKRKMLTCGRRKNIYP